MSQQEILEKALSIIQTQDMEEAKRYIRDTFGEDADLNIVKCDACGEILALVANILAVGLMGGDRKVNLEIYKHMRKHIDHANSIYGYSHGTGIPIGKTLYMGLASTAKRFNLTIEEALDKRIAYLTETTQKT